MATYQIPGWDPKKHTTPGLDEFNEAVDRSPALIDLSIAEPGDKPDSETLAHTPEAEAALVKAAALIREAYSLLLEHTNKKAE